MGTVSHVSQPKSPVFHKDKKTERCYHETSFSAVDDTEHEAQNWHVLVREKQMRGLWRYREAVLIMMPFTKLNLSPLYLSHNPQIVDIVAFLGLLARAYYLNGRETK